MKKQVTVGIPTLYCYDRLSRLCARLLGDVHPCIEARIVIIDNGGELNNSPHFHALDNDILEGIKIIQPSYNLGVPASWNLLIKECGQCIIANDDALFGLAEIARFLEEAEKNPAAIMFETHHSIGGFATFYVNKPEEWLQMGGFDELFGPAYFEDNDCRWRLKNAGNPVVQVALDGWSHDNGGTLYSGSAMHRRTHWCCFERNKSYYKMKWGGLPGAETSSIPFQNIHGSP
jgi:GT2 family glycosyltransferase